jgi:hypothetical protein
MYDSAGDHIPAGATDILAYTDGEYANVNTLRVLNPHARIHTISVAGQVAAEYEDVEPGCLWPPAEAVDRWETWRYDGTLGFYGDEGTLAQVRELLGGESDEANYFDANWTDIPHIDPGYAGTQYASNPEYDTSLIGPGFDSRPGATPAPAPTPPPPPTEEIDVNNWVLIRNTTTGQIALLYTALGRKQYIGFPATVTSLTARGILLLEWADDDYNSVPYL